MFAILSFLHRNDVNLDRGLVFYSNFYSLHHQIVLFTGKEHLCIYDLECKNRTHTHKVCVHYIDIVYMRVDTHIV